MGIFGEFESDLMLDTDREKRHQITCATAAVMRSGTKTRISTATDSGAKR